MCFLAAYAVDCHKSADVSHDRHSTEKKFSFVDLSCHDNTREDCWIWKEYAKCFLDMTEKRCEWEWMNGEIDQKFKTLYVQSYWEVSIVCFSGSSNCQNKLLH